MNGHDPGDEQPPPDERSAARAFAREVAEAAPGAVAGWVPCGVPDCMYCGEVLAYRAAMTANAEEQAP